MRLNRHGKRKRPGLRQRLAQEIREYLADLRSLTDALRTVEGMVAMVLILVVVGLTAAWFFLGLGFDRLLSVGSAWGVWRPSACRDIGDIQGLVLIIGGVTFFLVAAIAIGEMMRLVDRARHRQPVRARLVLIPALSMLGIGIAGLAMMRFWC